MRTKDYMPICGEWFRYFMDSFFSLVLDCILTRKFQN